MAGIVFTGCGLGRDAQAQTPQGPQPSGGHRRREVAVSGKRVRTVDIHAHCHIPEATALMGVKNSFPGLMIGPDRIKAMDEQGIDVEALSINPIFWYKADPDLARQVVKLQNEKLAEICAKEPERFVGLASVALQHPELAAEQLEEAVKRLGMRGAEIGGSVNGEELSDPKFHPFWAKAEALGATVFIHPQPAADLTPRLRGNGLLTNVIWNPLETTIALSHLIFEGTLDQFPRLRICAAHGGGYLPSYMNRSDHGCVTFPAQCKAGVPKLHPTEYVKRMYYDSLVFTPEALRHLVAEVGASQVMIGTDYPYPWVSEPVEHVLSTPGLTDADREAMLGGTAARLLGLAAPTR
jgi:aminocarboxymuconate-semialdehyde decarboxylase